MQITSEQRKQIVELVTTVCMGANITNVQERYARRYNPHELTQEIIDVLEGSK